MYDHQEGSTSYLGIEICEAGPDDSDSNAMFAEGGETDCERSEDGPCGVDLNRVPVILEEDLT